MKLIVVSYYDRVTGVFSMPMPAINRGSAIREFVARLDKSDDVSRVDQELYELGSYENETGVLYPLERPEFICKYETYMTEEKQKRE